MADPERTSERIVELRERRRQRILQSSEERMKKITGQIEPRDDLVKKNKSSDEIGASEDENLIISDKNCKTSPPLHSSTEPLNLTNTLSDLSRIPSPDEPNPQLPNGDQDVTYNNVTKAPKKEKDASPSTFVKARVCLMLIVGILVRWSFQFSFGQEYVQTIANPFVALEIAIVGYQAAVGMDLGENVKGGIWLSTLVLAGIKTEIIYTYKNIMGALTAAAGDFFVFFFGFISLHLLL